LISNILKSEPSLVRAIDTNYKNTADLKVTNYNEAMESKHAKIMKEVTDVEQPKPTKYGVVRER